MLQNQTRMTLYHANAAHFGMFLRSNGVENQWSVMPLNRVQVQPLSNLLIQYEALNYLGFGLIALTPPISVCFAL